MRYIKKLALNKKDPQNDRFSVLQDDRIVTTSKTSMEVPYGAKEDRPTNLVDGTVRFNTTLQEFEVYNSQNPGFKPWEILRTIRQATITSQDLGYGNYNDSVFGPLAYDINTAKPQNIFVFVDNVWQTPNTNYTLTTDPSAATTTLSVNTTTGVTDLFVNTLTNIDAGTPGVWRTVSGPAAIQVGTTVTSVNFVYDIVQKGYQLGISLPTTNSMTSGTTITISYNTGTYIQFTGPVPAKPVYALLGFDGYFPAGPAGNAFES
jgi:hypothetical protein